MASALTHAIAGLAIGTAFRRLELPTRFWVLGAVGAVIPDLDGVGFWLGVPYESIFGHRGFTHSVVFAALFATAGLLAFRGERYADIRARVWIYLFLATASHGMLDAGDGEAGAGLRGLDAVGQAVEGLGDAGAVVRPVARRDAGQTHPGGVGEPARTVLEIGFGEDLLRHVVLENDPVKPLA